MEKVQDINGRGTPYTRVAFIGSYNCVRDEFEGRLRYAADEKEAKDLYEHRDQIIRDSINKTSQEGSAYLSGVLKFGVLGSKKGGQSAEERGEDIDRFAEAYVDELRDKPTKPEVKSTNPLVHFNIVGRTRTHGGMDAQKTEISQTWWMNTKEGTGIAVVFDATSYREVPPDQDQELKQRTFRANDPHLRHFYRLAKEQVGENSELVFEEEFKKMAHRDGLLNSEGVLMPEDEYGFILSSRIPPRFFRGIVINRTSSHHEGYEMSVEEVATAVSSLMVKVYAEKKELLIPIYDAEGNLLWPQKMSYEEIKNFSDSKD